MKKLLLLTSALGLASVPCFATSVAAIAHPSDDDSAFSVDIGYYYQRSDWEGVSNSLADDAMNNIVRDAPYLRLNYRVFSNWYLSGFVGLENLSNDPDSDFLEINDDLRESFFGAQIKGTLYASDVLDIGAFLQYSNYAEYNFSGEFQDAAATLNQYDLDVTGLRDLLVGVTLQQDYRYFDIYGGLFYQNSQAKVSGSYNTTVIDDDLSVDADIGALLGAKFHTSTQTDINVEYQNRGDHGIDISFTYQFKKPKTKVTSEPVSEPISDPVEKTESTQVTEAIQALLASKAAGLAFYDSTIYFEEGSTSVGEDEKSKVVQLARFMEENSEAQVIIDGHCDCSGPASYNQKLSEERAQSVKLYLIEQYAIDDERILVEGLGEALPVATNDTEEGRSQNRRVRVYASE